MEITEKFKKMFEKLEKSPIFQKIEAKHLQAKADLEHALTELRAAKYNLSSKTHQIQVLISAQEEILLNSYTTKIDEGIGFFRAKLEYLRQPGRITQTADGSENNLILWSKKNAWNNKPTGN